MEDINIMCLGPLMGLTAQLGPLNGPLFTQNGHLGPIEGLRGSKKGPHQFSGILGGRPRELGGGLSSLLYIIYNTRVIEIVM